MAQSIGDRIESIKSRFDREIEKLSAQRDREIMQALADAGVNIPRSGGTASAAAAPAAAPKGKRRKKGGRKKKKKTTAAKAPSKRGRAKRLTKERKAGLVEKALELFSKNRGKRFSRGDIASHLGVKPTQVSTVLNSIQGLKAEGDKATRVYYM